MKRNLRLCWTSNYRPKEHGYIMHACEDGNSVAICGAVIQETGESVEKSDPPTCKRCLKKMKGEVKG